LIPKKFPIKKSVIFGCAIPTGAGIIINEIKPKKKHSLCIIGIGGVGLSILMACKMLKLTNVLVIDVDKKKNKYCQKIRIQKKYYYKKYKKNKIKNF
jgi:S-(hydroxymethyl)glutathione dehydrogenase/alcohol dehydrogenase